ncbi:hypothetical protein HWV07_19385 [Natronomonas salina]|uniref:DUF7553 family protein n=1 Tax=Natronomonas salina TaxID=1710540 RepID=UPI0015B77447|nr:hypothetical protein [Natronomonas salina]QLD91090.1 hypothetical protein HWV07_19385 [Natronomonas salina]
MNKHFEDTRYYLVRAAQTTKAGLDEELEPLRSRVASLRGRDEPDAEPSRLDRVRRELGELGTTLRSKLERVRPPRATR